MSAFSSTANKMLAPENLSFTPYNIVTITGQVVRPASGRYVQDLLGTELSYKTLPYGDGSGRTVEDVILEMGALRTSITALRSQLVALVRYA